MDSSCSVPDEFIGEDIYVVPMYVHLKDKSYKDILEISSRQLKEKIEKEDIIAKTSIPSIGDIKEYIEKIDHVKKKENTSFPQSGQDFQNHKKRLGFFQASQDLLTKIFHPSWNSLTQFCR